MIPLNPASPLIGISGTDGTAKAAPVRGGHSGVSWRDPRAGDSRQLPEVRGPPHTAAPPQRWRLRWAGGRGADIAWRKPVPDGGAERRVAWPLVRNDRRHAPKPPARCPGPVRPGALAVARKSSGCALLTRNFSGLAHPQAGGIPHPGPGGRHRSAGGCSRRAGRVHRRPVSSNGLRGGRQSR